MKRTLLLPLAATAALVVAACGGAAATPAPATPAPATEAPATEAPMSEAPMSEAPASEAPSAALGDIVDVASGAGTFTTLLAAAEAAGLVETLKSAGPFTVFAPTDDAFAKLPAGTVEGLLEDPEALKAILLYHVVAGKVGSDAVVGLTSADTVNGAPISIKVEDGSVILNDTVKVVTTDIETSNGVIHVIDGVLLPPTE